MSDVPQGPGWFQAADGKWYPPVQGQVAAATQTVPPPPQRPIVVKQGPGCLRTGLIVLAVLAGLTVLGVIGAALLLNEAAEDVEEDRQEEQEQEQADVTVGNCATNALGMMTATVTVTNNSSERSNYAGSVVFETSDGSQQLASWPILISGLEPGQSTTEQADTFTEATGEFTCRLSDVERFSDEN